MSDTKYRLAWENLTMYMDKINEIMRTFNDFSEVAADMPIVSPRHSSFEPTSDFDATLIAFTKQAAKLHYEKMGSMGAARTVALFASDGTTPAMGCMFVTGYDEIERLRAYAADGAHLASDNSVGEN